ncbi:hypothetical protein HaLaN_04007 [Haematococcus lacustris]|uniref:Uncharacterized protein n=1 Tax=Haematococcus lacustris TaxID=44745 RepID=A0A699YRR0_HAELA|nr:hypothetical protein HaLaN_04007 [Haematococcus lacustris]
MPHQAAAAAGPGLPLLWPLAQLQWAPPALPNALPVQRCIAVPVQPQPCSHSLVAADYTATHVSISLLGPAFALRCPSASSEPLHDGL